MSAFVYEDQENVPPARRPLGVRKPLAPRAAEQGAEPAASGTAYSPSAVLHQGEETCFEEYRARMGGWTARRRPAAMAPAAARAPPAVRPREEPEPSLDAFLASPPPAARAVATPVARAPRAAGIAAPSPTINTKLAMDDVMAMFGGAGGDDDDDAAGGHRHAEAGGDGIFFDDDCRDEAAAPAGTAAGAADAGFSVYCDEGDEGDELGDMVGFAPQPLDTILETSRECSTSAVLEQAVADPFCPATRQQILDAVLPGLGGVHLEDDDDAPFDVEAVLTLNEKNFDLGERMFNVEWALSASADGREATLLLTDLDDDDQVAMKLSREPSLWEYSIQHKLREAVGGTPHAGDFLLARELHLYRDCSCLLADVGEGRTLRDVLDARRERRLVVEEPLAMYYAVEALRIVGTLHAQGVLHCAVRPEAFHIRKEDDEDDAGEWGDWNAAREAGWRRRGLSLADFATAVDTAHYAAGTRFATQRPPAGFALPRGEAARPWLASPDLRGVAGVMHQLMHGGPLAADEAEPAAPAGWNAAAWGAAFRALASGRDSALHDARLALERALSSPELAKQVRPLVCRVHLAVLQD